MKWQFGMQCKASQSFTEQYFAQQCFADQCRKGIFYGAKPGTVRGAGKRAAEQAGQARRADRAGACPPQHAAQEKRPPPQPPCDGQVGFSHTDMSPIELDTVPPSAQLRFQPTRPCTPTVFFAASVPCLGTAKRATLFSFLSIVMLSHFKADRQRALRQAAVPAWREASAKRRRRPQAAVSFTGRIFAWFSAFAGGRYRRWHSRSSRIRSRRLSFFCAPCSPRRRPRRPTRQDRSRGWEDS